MLVLGVNPGEYQGTAGRLSFFAIDLQTGHREKEFQKMTLVS